jgi:hypothetical protein
MSKLLPRQIPHTFRLALALCSVLAGGLLFASTQALAAEGGWQSAGATPTVAGEAVSGITEHDAMLEAQINPGGLETTYEIQIGEPPEYKFEIGCLPAASCQWRALVTSVKQGTLPVGSEDQHVEVDLNEASAWLEPDTTYNYRVLAANVDGVTEGSDRTFTTAPRDATPEPTGESPTIEAESVSQITQHGATLEAKINPEGSETSYELWFVPGCSEGACERLPARVMAKAADIGDGHEGLVVDAQLTELEPGVSNNEYWVVASNAAGKSESAHQRFATPPQPRIESESVSAITEHDATLEAQINPNGLETAYEFEIDTDGSYHYPKSACPLGECDALVSGEPLPAGLVEPEPEHIPPGSGDQAVSLDLVSIGATLQPARTYHYRVIASNGSGPTVEGPDQTFTTPSQSTSPLEQGTEPSPPPGGGQPAVSPVLLSSPPAAVDLSSLPVPTTTKSKLTESALKLARALKVCEKKSKKQRAKCEQGARGRYARTSKDRGRKAS